MYWIWITNLVPLVLSPPKFLSTPDNLELGVPGPLGSV